MRIRKEKGRSSKKPKETREIKYIINCERMKGLKGDAYKFMGSRFINRKVLSKGDKARQGARENH